MADTIYKILRVSEWAEFLELGRLDGGVTDRQSDFIHFSSAAQLRGTLSRHYSAEAEVIVLQVRIAVVQDHLRWEPSRSGELFPHLYGVLYLHQVTNVERVLPRVLDCCRDIPGESPALTRVEQGTILPALRPRAT